MSWILVKSTFLVFSRHRQSVLTPFRNTLSRGLAGHASRAGLAGRVSCSGSVAYVARAGCVISALTDNWQLLIANCQLLIVYTSPIIHYT